VCANRIFVHRSVHSEVTRKLVERVKRMKVGPGDCAGNDIGPLINIAAVEKVEKLVASARSAGAQVLLGGDRDEAGGLFFEPTILDNVSNDMEIARSEIFGPVATLIPFDSEAEVIALANDTPYGLAAYFYSRDIGRVWRVGEALEYGMVGINQGIVSSAAAPFGGVKQSGLGREGSKYGLEDYLEIKYLCLGGIAE
jgi:succinate-semialdehyde dehydrogenase/glutarate-semialdehyde dehydrogenase